MIDQILGLTEDVMLGWVVPIFLIAIVSSVFSVLIATTSSIVAAIVIAAVTIMMVVYCYHRQAWWQSIFYGGIGVIYLLLSLVAPEWAILWGLMITVIALSVIAVVPGAVLPGARRVIASSIIFATIVHIGLAWSIWQSANVFPLLLAIIIIAMGGYIFGLGARPHEIRLAQRITGRLLGALGVVLLLVIFLSNVPLPSLSMPRPVIAMYNAISAKVESYQLSAQREVIGQRAKTESLQRIEPLVTSLHKARWLQEAEKIPSFPLSKREWEELGIENPTHQSQ